MAPIYASDISSSSMKNEHIFRLVNPFVEVKKGKVGKFEDAKLKSFNKDVAEYLLKEVLLEMQKFGECYARNTIKVTEVQYRPVSCAMFPVFAGLAPRKDEVLEGEKGPKSKDAVFSFDMSPVPIPLEKTEANKSRPNSLASDSSGGSNLTQLTGHSYIADTFVHEDGTLLRSHESVDIGASVTYHNNKQVVRRSVFEMKGEQKWPVGLYQGLNYGARHLVGNIGYERYKKFHVVVMGIDWVGCAEMDPIGFVTVDQHQKLSGVELFKKQVEAKIGYLSKKKKGKDQEIKRLQTRYLKPDAKKLQEDLTKEMIDNMKAAGKKAGADYAPEFKKETKLLIGTAKFRENSFSMNRFPINADKPVVLEHELITIIKGLARVIYGDRVLEWKLVSLKKHAQKRKDEREAWLKRVLPGVKL